MSDPKDLSSEKVQQDYKMGNVPCDDTGTIAVPRAFDEAVTHMRPRTIVSVTGFSLESKRY